MDKLQGLRKHCTVNWRALTTRLGAGLVSGGARTTTTEDPARLCEAGNFVYLFSSKQELQLIFNSSSLSKMTSFPEFGEATTATEVADAFSLQIKGKNGTATSLFFRICEED